MSSAIYPGPPRPVTAVCGHGEQQRLSNARLRLTFYNAPVAYCGPARPGSAFQQSAVSGLLPRARRDGQSSNPNRIECLALRVPVHDPVDEGDAEIDVLGRASGGHVRLPTPCQELLDRGVRDLEG